MQAAIKAERKARRLRERFRADATAIVTLALDEEQAVRRARGQDPLLLHCPVSGPDWAKFMLSAKPAAEPHIEIVLTHKAISVKAFGWPADPEINPAPAVPVHETIPLVAKTAASDGASGAAPVPAPGAAPVPAPVPADVWTARLRDALRRGIAELRL